MWRRFVYNKQQHRQVLYYMLQVFYLWETCWKLQADKNVFDVHKSVHRNIFL